MPDILHKSTKKLPRYYSVSFFRGLIKCPNEPFKKLFIPIERMPGFFIVILDLCDMVPLLEQNNHSKFSRFEKILSLSCLIKRKEEPEPAMIHGLSKSEITMYHGAYASYSAKHLPPQYTVERKFAIIL